MVAIKKIEGIGESYGAKLQMLGITSVEELLAQGSTPKGRQSLAEKSGIGERLVLEWVNRADLFRIKGIGEEYSDLLEACGVDTVVELAQRNAQNLYEKMVALNREKRLVRKLPALSQVSGWIEQAKKLPRVVSY